jgi:hypothetical protein
MNIRRGTFRVWLVLSAIFVIVIGAMNFAGIQEEFTHAYYEDNMAKKWGWAELLPVNCAETRGSQGSDYTRNQDGLCWYEIGKFRALYPEYKDISNKDLSKTLHEKAGKPLTEYHPWLMTITITSIALGVPLAVFILGYSLLWALAGFQSKSTP